jgi:hypothetical protein
MPAHAPAKELPSETLSLEEQIQRRAYELYVERGNQSVPDLNDRLQTEEEILWAERDARVNEASEASFPASDEDAR